MNVSDILTRVKRKFGDESGVQITDDDITRWINDGQRQIVLANENLLQTTAAADTVDGQQEYDLPVDILVLQFVQYKAEGQDTYFKLKGMTVTEFNEYIDGWTGGAFNNGTPTVHTVYAGKLLLFPIPDHSKTDAIKIYYNRQPTDVSELTDTPDLPVLYHETLVKHCMSQAYEQDEDFEAAGMKINEVTSDVNMLRGREDWKTQERYPTITVLEEDWL